MHAIRNFFSLAAAAGLVLVCAGAHVQSSAGYPNRVVKIVVPFAAGGGTDLMARNIARS